MEVEREKLAVCMTCPLCQQLLDEATTISLCQHTFCRKCIYDKFLNEGNSCPLCNISLGAIPIDKLRADHNLQSVMAKIFPYERREDNVSGATIPTPSPVKIKERSVSSLVDSTPQMPIQSGSTGVQTRFYVRRAALQGSSISGNGKINKKHTDNDVYPRNSAHKARQEQTTFADQRNEKDYKSEVEGPEADLFTPLKSLAEAINKSKSSKWSTEGPSHVALKHPNNDDELLAASKCRGESPDASVSQTHTSRKITKEHGGKRKVKNERNGSDMPPGRSKSKKLQANKNVISQDLDADDGANGSRKLQAVSRNRNVISQDLDTDNGANGRCQNFPVWFMLVASNDQEKNVSLPQISSRYLRIKDGSMPVKIIQKYLARKFNLSNESEVEIMCQGQQLLPTMQLHSLLDLWFRTTSTAKKIAVHVGASANDFIMVLNYCRKVPAT